MITRAVASSRPADGSALPDFGEPIARARPSRLYGAVNRAVSRIKGSRYVIDDQVAGSYLAVTVISRIAMVARGRLMLPRHRGPVFIAGGARFRARGHLAVGRGVTFGPHTFVDAMSTHGVALGDNVSLGRNTRIEATGNLQNLGRGMVVGDNVGLGSDAFYGCAGGIRIGENTIVGNLVTMHSENHRFEALDVPIREQGVEHQGIVIGSDCWLGAKVTVLDGVRLGRGCVVAAGAVLRAGEYPAGGVYGGVPARSIGTRGA